MVYSGDLKSPVERHAGSSPASGTKFGFKVFMDAHWLVTPEDGDRYPVRPPSCVAINLRD